jgi:hypothetical protein
VLEFQKSNQLTADGIVGPRTIAKLFEEEQLSITLALIPQEGSQVWRAAAGHPAAPSDPTIDVATADASSIDAVLSTSGSFSRVPMLTPAGQTVSLLTTVPVRNDPVDPATRSFNEIMRLLIICRRRFRFVEQSSAPSHGLFRRWVFSSSTQFHP